MTNTATIPEWTVSDRLRKAREQAGISVEGMASLLAVTRNTITNYERHPGKRGVSRAVLLTWAALCDVDPDWLETGQGSRSRCFEPSLFAEAAA